MDGLPHLLSSRLEGTESVSPYSSERDIYRHTLHQQIPNEQNTHAGLILIPHEIQILLEAGQPRRRDVIPVQIVQDIHDDDDGQQPPVDLAHEGLLGLLAVLGRQASNVGRSFSRGMAAVCVGDMVDEGLGCVVVVVREDFAGSTGHFAVLDP